MADIHVARQMPISAEVVADGDPQLDTTLYVTFQVNMRAFAEGMAEAAAALNGMAAKLFVPKVVRRARMERWAAEHDAFGLQPVGPGIGMAKLQRLPMDDHSNQDEPWDYDA